MKTNQLKFASFVAAVLVCLGLGSCSKAMVESDLMAIASDDASVVAFINPQTIIDNAGCEASADGIVYSDALNKLIAQSSKNDKQTAQLIANFKGLDYSGLLIVAKADKKCGFCAFAIDDKKAFDKSLSELGDEVKKVDSQDGYDIYAIDDDASLIANEANGYIVNAPSANAYSALKAQLADAEANPLKEWKKEVLAEGNAANVVMLTADLLKLSNEETGTDVLANNPMAQYFDIDAFRNSIVGMAIDLNGMKATLTSRCYNADGSLLDTKVKLAPVDTKMLRYANDGDIMAMMLNLGYDCDWSQVLDIIVQSAGGYRQLGINKQQLEIVAQVLNSIDGTVMIAAAPTDIAQINKLEGWQLAIAAEFKQGEAQKYFAQIKALADGYSSFLSAMGISYSATDKSLEISIPRSISAYAQVDGDVLAISTTPITGNAKTALNADYFKGNAFGMELTLPSGMDALVGMQLPFQPTLAIASNNERAQLVLELDGDGDKLLDAIFTFAAGLR